MGRTRQISLLTCLLSACALPVWGAGTRDPEAEARHEAALRAVAPGVVSTFQEATRALDRDDAAAAEAGYRKVLQVAPAFPPALRRLSYVVKSPPEALTLARKALASEDHAHNRVAVVRALLRFEKDAGKSQEALALCRRLAKDELDDPETQGLVGQVALQQGDIPLFRESLQRLRRIEPEGMLTHYFLGIEAVIGKDWTRAEQELLRAKELGMPADLVDSILKDAGITSGARTTRLASYTGYGLVAWLAGLVVLLLAGVFLSSFTLATVKKENFLLTGEVAGSARLIRRLYAAVLGLTSLYFYLSLPIVLLLVLGLGAGLIYAFVAMGRIPVKLVAVIAIVVLITFWAMLKSLFIRHKDEDPGRRLSEEDAPGLFAMLREVSEQIRTPMVDDVFVVPGATAAVFERGSFWRRITGRTRRCMIIGLGLLQDMTQLQFKAILAHEFGHLVNQDTAGGSLALHVRNSLQGTAQGLLSAGAAAWYNPAWLFLNAYYRIYLRISQGASRLQEVLADRRAVLAYGAQAFMGGLRHVVRRASEFELLANLEIASSLESKRKLANLYELRLPEEWPGPSQSKRSPLETVEAAFEKAMGEQTSAYDSHPAPSERIALVAELPGLPEVQDDRRPAWELLGDAKKHQEEMTREVEGDLQRAVRMQQAGG